MQYDVLRGRIQTWALECQIVDHCTLRCVHCCTLSPFLPARVASPETLGRDLRALAPVLEPRLFKLTGGEPTLHPDLLGCIEAARQSGIAPEISITTNGFLLRKLEAPVWEALDRMTISWYSGRPLPEPVLVYAEAQAERHGVKLTIKPTSHFQELTRAHSDPEKSFASCWMKRRCHSVRDGFFYLCTRPPHVATWRGQPEHDGLEIDAPGLRSRLLRYLQREEPLQTCSWCLGNLGDWVPWSEQPRG